MRIMTGSADLAGHCAEAGIPIAARATVHAGFPIAISRPMTTAAQGGAVCDFQFASVASLEGVEFVFVVAVKAIIVAPMAAVAHDNVFVLLRNNNLLVFIKL